MRYFFLASALLSTFVLPLHAEEAAAELVAANRAVRKEISPPAVPADGLTINYNTVSLVEYIRFASKICNVNFIFNEADLNFTVTIVSEGPITPENVMATLVQVLRIHGLQLLEQDNNLVIHTSDDVKQIATLVQEGGKGSKSPIVTRIFRIKNAKAESLAAIIKPMLSQSAMLEVSSETRQLILTDVTANVDKVASLIENLDSPHTQFEIKSFEAQHNQTEYLIKIAGQLMAPMAQGNPFILVPANLANTIFVVSTPELTTKALEVLKSLDTPPKESLAGSRNIFVYKLQNRSGDIILQGLTQIGDNLEKSGAPETDLLTTLDSAKWIRETNSIMITGSPESVTQVREFILALDAAGEGSQGLSFFVYKPLYKTAKDVSHAVQEMAQNLQSAKGADPALIETMQSATINGSTQSITFSGQEGTFLRVRELLATIDSAGGRSRGSSKNNFFLYKIQSSPSKEIETSLRSFAKNIDSSSTSEEGLAEAIEGMKYIPETNSLLFTAPDPVLKRVQEVVAAFDSGISSETPLSNQFLIYKPKTQKGDILVLSLKDVTDNLKNNSLADANLLRTLQSGRWVKTTNSLLFTGDPGTLKKVEGLLTVLDQPGMKPGGDKSFFLYQIQYHSKEKAENYLKQVADSLNKRGDEELVDTIRSGKWIEPSHSFMFHGTQDSLTKLKELLASYDNPAEAGRIKAGYYIYKLQNENGEAVEEDLDKLAKDFKSSGMADSGVLSVIENIRYVKETNSLLLTGDPRSIDEVKELIGKYDYPRGKGQINSHFFLYKPQHLSANAIETSLKDIGKNLKKADLADPALLAAIDSMKYIDTTNSLIFTGSSDALAKIQALMQDVDAPLTKHTSIQHVGKKTFLLVKLKYASGSQVTTALQTMINDLKKSDTTDKDFLAALETMKYVRETNSLFFTGQEDALTRVQTLVERFDVVELAGPKTPVVSNGPTNFFVYKPQSVSGVELEKLLDDFGENLKMTGLSDPDLFNTIASMRWVDKTQSLIFTGSTKSLEQVKDLLKSFDIPANLPLGAVPGGPLEPSIQAIDNTSFLVYKLQFHKGDEIQGALRQIAKDLILSNAPVNQNLLNSINSIQWLEVTNSLLCSGDQETLTRLRELVKSLDIPLKQVFIEMLVVQTTLTNALQFGLEWAGKYKYRDKFSGAINNSAPPPANSSTAGITPFLTEFQKLNSRTTPTPAMIGFNPAFDLGVIGEVIRHNGDTFLTLGSLLTALQTDDETTVVMTPKLITQDGRTSTIFSGQNIPFAGSFTSNQSSNLVSTTNLEYRDIGINLTITPVLGNSDIVTLDIALDQTQTATDAANQQIQVNPSGTSTSINGITTSKTSMQTTVHVPDNHFLILSGMVNNTNVKSKSGIPCLGGLPLIGAAFSKDNNTITNTNIVIFLRPHILTSMDDLRSISEAQEQFFREQAGTPYLEHNYDEAMELIKSVDDE